MSTDVTYCARGCVRRRQHLSDCNLLECTGCIPRQAESGKLCWPCHRRFELMLTQAEITERWLTGNLPAGTTAGGGREDYEQRGSKKAPPAPLSVAILDARQALQDRLACWVDDLAESREIRSAPTRHTVTADSKFLLTWLTTVESVDHIGDWFEELAETMSDAHCVAPWRPEVNRLRGIPCPECHNTALVIFGGETDVTCTECKHMMGPDRYGIWTRMLLDEEQKKQAKLEAEKQEAAESA